MRPFAGGVTRTLVVSREIMGEHQQRLPGNDEFQEVHPIPATAPNCALLVASGLLHHNER